LEARTSRDGCLLQFVRGCSDPEECAEILRCVQVYIYLCVCVYIYIYVCVCVCVCVCV